MLKERAVTTGAAGTLGQASSPLPVTESVPIARYGISADHGSRPDYGTGRPTAGGSSPVSRQPPTKRGGLPVALELARKRA